VREAAYTYRPDTQLEPAGPAGPGDPE
jgi:hypothetical protein